MTTGLIVAPPAIGKTAACIRLYSAYSIHAGELPPWQKSGGNTGSAASLRISPFRHRLADSGGAMGTYVGTFGDLYKAILESAGTYVPVASSPLLHRLVQETVDRAVEQGELLHFLPIQSMPGCIVYPGSARILCGTQALVCLPRTIF